MKSVSSRDLVKALERKGWVLLRVHGSHHIYGREGSPVRLSIPMHEGRDLKMGLVRHLMKMADVTEDDL
jgi:predicted RNA binding protein YcfA (HicA-like mRNA interferase family)